MTPDAWVILSVIGLALAVAFKEDPNPVKLRIRSDDDPKRTPQGTP